MSKEGVMTWLEGLVSFGFDYTITLIVIFLVLSSIAYKYKCEKNITELILEALRTGDKHKNIAILIFMFLLTLSQESNLVIRVIGYLGTVAMIVYYSYKAFGEKDEHQKIKDKVEDNVDDQVGKSTLGRGE